MTDPQNAMSRDVVGVILAGGRSRRMGTDKTRLPIGARSMLERAVDRLRTQVRWLVVSIGEDGEPPPSLDLPVVRDAGERFGGPLRGIAAALAWAKDNTDARWVVSVPADAPFLPADLVSRLLDGRAADAEVAIARSLGRLHPVVALWPVALADDLERWLATSLRRAVMAWLETRRWSAVDFPCAATVDPFLNVNTPDDLAVARQYDERLP